LKKELKALSRLLIQRINPGSSLRGFSYFATTERRRAGNLKSCIAGEGVVFHPSSSVNNFQLDKTVITIGRESQILGQLLVMAHGGRIEIGHSCFIGENSRIWSAAAVRIGDRVLISHGVNIHDTNSHSLSAASRHEHVKRIFSEGHPRSFTDPPPHAPITIEDDAWIGFNSIVLKGVTIGKGAVIGAGSVVTRDVDPFAVVVGNPARVIGESRP
jgi:acetyltransferase-like isoleucine patch superfamily enzyme